MLKKNAPTPFRGRFSRKQQSASFPGRRRHQAARVGRLRRRSSPIAGRRILRNASRARAAWACFGAIPCKARFCRKRLSGREAAHAACTPYMDAGHRSRKEKTAVMQRCWLLVEPHGAATGTRLARHCFRPPDAWCTPAPRVCRSVGQRLRTSRMELA